MSVVDDLKKIGGEVEVQHGAFNQRSFRGDTVSVDGVSLTGGYCAGVVLDWARRVLLSASDRDQKYLNYSTTNSQARRAATLERMAKAYAGQGGHYITGDTFKVQALNLLNQLKVSGEETFQSYGTGVPVTNDGAVLFKKFWQIPGAPNTIFAKFNLAKEPAGVLTYTNIQTLIDNLTPRPDAQHSPLSVDGRHWETFAAELDEDFALQRTSRGRDATNKPFSNLRVVSSRPEQNYAGGGQWLGVLMANGLQENCCSVVGFAPSNGGNGHAVAVHQKGVNEFIFFDPNYGAFRYTRENLKNCFQHLFWTPYIQAATGVLDGTKAVYLRRETINHPPEGLWNKMGYTIFANKYA
ncbi:MAG TPA: YopT-type cysteine protease domain-containing protein [Bryobacteraceae bacterium]|jgi:hypothetical protein